MKIRLSHSGAIAQSLLMQSSQKLLAQILSQKVAQDQKFFFNKKLQAIDADNPEYAERIGDGRSVIHATLYVLLLIATFGVDVMLLFSAISILLSFSKLPNFLKYVIPGALPVIEVGMAIHTARKLRSGHNDAGMGKGLQFFVIALLIGFSVVSVSFLLEGANPIINQCIWCYVFKTILVQLVLLIPSIMLHYFILRHAEDIAEAAGFLTFRYQRQKISKKASELEKVTGPVYAARFIADCHRFVGQYQDLKRISPEAAESVEESLPFELTNAVNTMMGRTVIILSSSANTLNTNNHDQA